MSDGYQNVDPGDVLRIMVATDNHLGYGEKDVVRGEDSFTAFEEILELALSENVDMILLGGDLFHDAVPSQNALHKCMKLLRRYTFGDKPVSMEYLSDQTLSFHNAICQTVNYADPNLNISIPVFSIHGNHDDPSGFGRLSSLDLLCTTGLVNYFGRWTDLTKVEINPILLRKGVTQLALYGLSHIHDARLARLFENNKVTIKCPNKEQDDEEWFHLMVLHQNRAERGPKNYVPEEILPEFMHLVIWGHEHDCRIEPEYNTKHDFYVSQPGSSVPTSLSEGEAIKKHVGLLKIYKTKFQMEPIALKTVRPFVFESVNLAELIDELGLDEGDASNKVKKMAEERVEAMIERAKDMLTGHPKQPTKPLVRLRIIFTNEEQMFNAMRFGQMYNERVANPADVILFKKFIQKTKKETVDLDKEAMKSAFEKMEMGTEARVEDLVDRYFQEVDDKRQLKLMSSNALSEMCHRLVDRHDANAADNILKFCKEKAIDYLMETLPDEDIIDEKLIIFKENIKQDDILKMLDERGSIATNQKSNSKQQNDASKDFLFSDPSTSAKASTTTPRGRGRGGRGRGARGAAAAAAPSSSTRGRRAMPQLDVSVNTTRSSAQQKTLLDAVGQSRTRRGNKIATYVISDDDSD